MKRIIALIVVLIAIGVYAVLTYPSPEATADLPLTKTKYEIGPPDPTEMLELVNKEREKVGVPPLTYDANVEKSAQLKAEDFAERDYFSHNLKGRDYTLTDEMARYVNMSCSSSFENIRWLPLSTATSENTIYAWRKSKPHYDAMVDPKSTSTGFGIVEDTEDERYYIVQRLCVA